MSSAPVIREESDGTSRLSQEQWWALFDELRLAQQATYAEVGGAAAYLRRERDADTASD